MVCRLKWQGETGIVSTRTKFVLIVVHCGRPTDSAPKYGAGPATVSSPDDAGVVFGIGRPAAGGHAVAAMKIIRLRRLRATRSSPEDKETIWVSVLTHADIFDESFRHSDNGLDFRCIQQVFNNMGMTSRGGSLERPTPTRPPGFTSKDSARRTRSRGQLLVLSPVASRLPEGLWTPSVCAELRKIAECRREDGDDLAAEWEISQRRVIAPWLDSGVEGAGFSGLVRAELSPIETLARCRGQRLPSRMRAIRPR